MARFVLCEAQPVAASSARPLRRRIGTALLDVVRSHSLGSVAAFIRDHPGAQRALLEAARYHRLDALVADLAAEQPAPVPLARELEGMRRTHSMRRVSLVADLQWLRGVLEPTSPDFVVFKGPVTAERHYASPTQRSYSDLDVLVRPSKFEGAVDRLIEAGAHQLERNWPLVRQLGCGELNLLLPFGTALDLHWTVVAAPHDRGAFSVDPVEILERRVNASAHGMTVAAPDLVDELVHLCLHAALSGTSSIGRLRDVNLAAAGPVDWDEVIRRSRHWRVNLPVAVVLDRCARLFGPEPGPGPAIRRTLAGPGGWRPAAQLAGRVLPEVLTPPVSRWSSHMKLTRSTALRSYAYTATELAGWSIHRVRRRDRDGWDQLEMRRTVDDASARSGYYDDVASQDRRSDTGLAATAKVNKRWERPERG